MPHAVATAPAHPHGSQAATWAARQQLDDKATDYFRARGAELAAAGEPNIRGALLAELTKPGGLYDLLDDALNEVMAEYPAVRDDAEAGNR